MNKSEFIKEFSEYCEFEESDIKLDTELKSIEGFDSMAILAIIAFADEKFGIKLPVVQIRSATDIESLSKLLGINKFEDD